MALFTVQIAGLFMTVHISATKDGNRHFTIVTVADTYNNLSDDNYDYYDTYKNATVSNSTKPAAGVNKT